MVTLNADLGEYDGGAPGAREAEAAQAQLVALIHVANVACGGHAGDERTMRATVAQCTAHGVAVGAHPSYPDRAGFGRTTMVIAHDALRATLAAQIAALAALTPIAHVKAHGALYHDVARDAELAALFADVVAGAAVAAVMLPLGAKTRPLFVARGLRVLNEGFADRRYASDGTLVPRAEGARAMIHDAAEAAAQAQSLRGRIDTLCVHGDSENALAIAEAVRAALS
jgi:UPF0271 protein